MHQVSARAVSLPLFNLMHDVDQNATVGEAARKLWIGIDELHLSEHVEPVIEFEHDQEFLSIQAKDDLGKDICNEVMVRFDTPPCPEGMCEPVPGEMDGNCKWCGRFLP